MLDKIEEIIAAKKIIVKGHAKSPRICLFLLLRNSIKWSSLLHPLVNLLLASFVVALAPVLADHDML